MSDYTPKPAVVALATLLWLLAAAVMIAMQFDDLPTVVRVIVGALTLLALWLGLFASPRVRFSSFEPMRPVDQPPTCAIQSCRL